MPNNVMCCKCDILQTNQRIYIQIWQVSLLCCSAIHYAFLADFDLLMQKNSCGLKSGSGLIRVGTDFLKCSHLPNTNYTAFFCNKQHNPLNYKM